MGYPSEDMSLSKSLTDTMYLASGLGNLWRAMDALVNGWSAVSMYTIMLCIWYGEVPVGVGEATPYIGVT